MGSDPQQSPQMADPLAGLKPQCEMSLRDEVLEKINFYEAMLAPPSDMEVAEQLLRCLTLTAPSGMTQADREEWLAVAMPEVSNIPQKIFLDACAKARRTCDHPAKIVPAICKYEPEREFMSEGFLRRQLSSQRATLGNMDKPKIDNRPVIDPMAVEKERREIAVSMGQLLKDLKSAARLSD